MAHSSATMIVAAEVVIDNREGQGKVGKTMESYGREDLITGFATGMTMYGHVFCAALLQLSRTIVYTIYHNIENQDQLVLGT